MIEFYQESKIWQQVGSVKRTFSSLKTSTLNFLALGIRHRQDEQLQQQ